MECNRARRVFTRGMRLANEGNGPPSEGHRMEHSQTLEFLTFSFLVMSILGILMARGF